MYFIHLPGQSLCLSWFCDVVYWVFSTFKIRKSWLFVFFLVYFVCGSFLFVFVFAYCLVLSVYCSLVVCWERADLLVLLYVTFCCVFVSHMVSWVRCGTGLYQFLTLPSLLVLVCVYIFVCYFLMLLPHSAMSWSVIVALEFTKCLSE